MSGAGDKVGVLVISYGSRGAAIIDALSRSEEYAVELYVADKQRNPFNVAHATKHLVIPDLDIRKICDFAAAHRQSIDFGICGPEKPIIAGVRDLIERETGVPMICPTKQFALEVSKVAQRYVIEQCCPEANPRFEVFPHDAYPTVEDAKKAVWRFLDEIGNGVAVKPDSPTAGKGVGVWGDHFSTRAQLFEHFRAIFESGSDVLLEEKLVGEESSFQAFCDGNRLVPLPDTRDHKRAFDHDLGPNTGGMGSYKDTHDWLPFMTERDRESEEQLVQQLFRHVRGEGTNEGLRGIPFYVAFMHTREGPKILEINSRPGDPEIINILPVLTNDFVELCFHMLEGKLTHVECAPSATVVTYAVPMEYGGYREVFRGDRRVDLTGVHALTQRYGDTLRVYPGSMELRDDGTTYTLGSRTVCTVGIGASIEEARAISVEGVRHIDGPLWNRWDIGARHLIAQSVDRMKALRG